MGKDGMETGRRGRAGNVSASASKRRKPAAPFYIVLGVIALAGIGAIVYSARRPKAAVATVDPNAPPIQAEGYLLGAPNAPVQVIEFADFECPACSQFATLAEPDIK